jgi:hypothetical protein
VAAFATAEHGNGVVDSDSVAAAVDLGDAGGERVGIAPRPVALKLQQVLQTGHRADTGLDHALHRPLVRFVGDVAAGIGNHIDLKALVERRQRGADDTDTGPEAGDDETVLTDPVDGIRDLPVLPTVHGGTIDDPGIGECLLDFVEDRARKALFRNRGEDGGNAEARRTLGHQGRVVA